LNNNKKKKKKKGWEKMHLYTLSGLEKTCWSSQGLGSVLSLVCRITEVPKGAMPRGTSPPSIEILSPAQPCGARLCLLLSDWAGDASNKVRQRYWARNMLGWEAFSRVQPNPAHTALALMEHAGVVKRLVTQNVDRLHQRGGSQHVTELHGHNWAVRCLSCGHEEERTHFQTRLIDANHHWVSSLDLTPPLDNTELEEQTTGIRPDGDANVSSDYSNFQVPSCMACQKGIMKPTVVFFGENVPRATVDETMSHTLTSDGVLVIGSSLMVYSAFRFVHAADENHIPIALINLGPTRADSLASLHLKLDLKAGEILPLLAAKLLSTIS
jgi:NAD-dependent deacetylase sirtuin 4